jgi:hypothetical protein
MTSRRGFLFGLTSLFAAPAIVRASSLMVIKPLPLWVPAAVVPFAHIDTAFVEQYRKNVEMMTRMYGAQLRSVIREDVIIGNEARFERLHIQ